MPIAGTCPSCRRTFTAPDAARGRKAKCPKCGAAFLVGADADAPEPTAGPAPCGTAADGRVAPSAEETTSEPAPRVPALIPCPACGRSIACSAAACPGCGAANDWVHPEIRRFLASKDRFAGMPPFRYTHDKFVLRGTAAVVRGAHALAAHGWKAVAGGFLCMLIGAALPGALGVVLPWVVGPVAFFAGLVMLGLGLLGKTKETDYVVGFTIDFRPTPPAWRSDDAAFWKDVKDFFLAAGPRDGG